MKTINKFKLTTPVLFLVFNRFDGMKKVFEEIRKAKPSQLFIAADGPRSFKEKEKTDAVRDYIIKKIDWKCKIKTLFRDKNLGCKYAVSEAINWFFKNVEQGIILEDDCLPNQSFFKFCQELLEKYKSNEKIMQISGTNIEVTSKIKEDYFFSKCFNIWGWATWKRAWKDYDVEMKKWPKYRIKIFRLMKNYTLLNKIKSFRLYELTYKNRINTWDYQWDFLCRIKNALAIIPKNNLITNLGFIEGTHTTNYKKKEKTLKRKEIVFPIKTEGIKLLESYQKNYFKFFK
jgi:GR25 family glycosyltransferase involved in LPS biosynthesis